MSGNDVDLSMLEALSRSPVDESGCVSILPEVLESMTAEIRRLRSVNLQRTWIACADYLPETGARRSAMSGWSKWLLCTNNEETIDDGGYCFTAAYSSELGCWHKLGNDKCKVTHWMPLLERPA